MKTHYIEQFGSKARFFGYSVSDFFIVFYVSGSNHAVNSSLIQGRVGPMMPSLAALYMSPSIYGKCKIYLEKLR